MYIAALLVAVAAAPARASDVDYCKWPVPADTLLMQTKPEEVLAACLRLARGGNSSAQFNVGGFYELGQGGVAQDYAEAARWYRKSADQGYPAAQHRLWILYVEGLGVPQNNGDAAKWFRSAADQGYPAAVTDDREDCGRSETLLKTEPARVIAACRGIAALNGPWGTWGQYKLGRFYDKGQGVPHDYAEAAKWYRKAAEGGDRDAQYYLGILYYNGQGVPQDYVEATKWLRQSERHGNSDAHDKLEFMHERGEDVLPVWPEPEPPAHNLLSRLLIFPVLVGLMTDGWLVLGGVPPSLRLQLLPC